MKPYNDVIFNNEFIREFSINLADTELVWHRDLKTRHITILSGTGWKFQFEDELPFELKIGDEFEIYEKTFHRIFKGIDNLVIKIKE